MVVFIETGSSHKAEAGLSLAALLPQPPLGAGCGPFRLFLLKNRISAELCGRDHSSGTTARTDPPHATTPLPGLAA